MNVQTRVNFDRIRSNLTFGIARGLTTAAKAGQAESIRAIQSQFTTRGSWFQPSNRFGIKVRPARKDNLTAEISTKADWLAIHETGGTKTPRGNNIAIPTDQVRRNKRNIITKGNRPKGFGSKAFVINTKRGRVLVQRVRGYQNNSTDPRWKNIRFLYWFEPSAKIRKQPTFYEPIMKFLQQQANRIVANSIRDAMK